MSSDLLQGLAIRTGQILLLTGLSQRAFAQRVGVSHSFISLVCKAKSMPSVVMLVGMRQSLDISLDWYLLGLGEPFVGEAVRASIDPETADIWQHLLPSVLATGPEAQGRVRGFLMAMAGAPVERRRAQSA